MRLVFFISVILFSCTPQSDRIIVPEVTDSFYHEALIRINQDLKGDKENLQLVEQKLYYCDLLQWPTTCINALDELKRQKGMTPQLFHQYVSYYVTNGRHQLLLDLINRWAKEFSQEERYIEEKIDALTALRYKEEPYTLLRKYLLSHNELKDLEFASQQYLRLEDTLMSAYLLGKVNRQNPSSMLVFDHYADILFDLGYSEQAFPIYEKYRNQNPDDFDFCLKLSTLYEEVDQLQYAREVIKQFADLDTIVYRIADLFKSENKWDSAHMYVDLIIERDSVNRKAWWTKARMYEDRGWLSYSLNYYDHLIYLSPTDTLAQQRAALVRRKIAYLQRLKFEENKLPLPVLESKKISN